MVVQKSRRDEKETEKEKRKEERKRGDKSRGVGCSVKETLEQGGVPADIHEEGFGRPAPGSLDDGRGNTMLSQSSRAACPHRLPRNVTSEEKPQSVEEERAGGDGTRFCKPERGSHWVDGVP